MNTGNISNELFVKKLAEFLHDPPEKMYDFGKEHKDKAGRYANSFKAIAYENDKADHMSSAADRFIFPKDIIEKENKFIHPCSGEEFSFENSREAVEEGINAVVPGVEECDDVARFWAAWRVWRHHIFEKCADAPFLLADTRIPDHSIWNHCSMASAIEAVISQNRKPAFMLLKAGPVQDFIAQARSTRDLWSGSFLLSWLMANAIQQVVKDFGPDNIIFPSLWGQPLIDFLNKDVLSQIKQKGKEKDSENFWSVIIKNGSFYDRLLIPNLPNTFFAIVSSDYDINLPEKAFREEWSNIAAKCADWLSGKGLVIPRKELWDFQISNFWEITSVIYPWQEDLKYTLCELKKIPSGKDHAIHKAFDVAVRIPEKERDYRCYNDGVPYVAWGWSAHYELASYLMSARRQTRNFLAWIEKDKADKVVKDVYSGKEETVLDKIWLEKAMENPETRHLFRKENEYLGAINLIKRIWHKAYLENVHNIKVSKVSFDSVYSVAAAPWRKYVINSIKENSDCWQEFVSLQEILQEHQSDIPLVLPDKKESAWIKEVDPEIFDKSFWEQLPKSEAIDGIIASLSTLLNKVKSKPAKYYAVLAMDGDEMGKWMSGNKTPLLKDVLSKQVSDKLGEKEYFKDFLSSARYLSPAWHLQFSEALSNFALYCAKEIVEAYDGQLIYAGGDDVLAMLPAANAVECALALRQAFQGVEYKNAKTEANKLFEFKGGFVRPRGKENSWWLMVPGSKATVSVGISIGHVKEPLQDMIRAAQAAEKDAKSFGRNALSVTLFKRSGEHIKWQTKFSNDVPCEDISNAFRMLELMKLYYRKNIVSNKEPIISGRFPYRIVELLSKYEPAKIDDDMAKIISKEFEWAVDQMEDAHKHKDVLIAFKQVASAWLQEELKGRDISSFYNLFAVEAFIARQGEV